MFASPCRLFFTKHQRVCKSGMRIKQLYERYKEADRKRPSAFLLPSDSLLTPLLVGSANCYAE